MWHDGKTKSKETMREEKNGEGRSGEEIEGCVWGAEKRGENGNLRSVARKR